MFNSLSGTITGKFPQKIYLDTHGIEWELTVPDSNLDKIPAVGEQGRVFVYMQHTENLMNLFGFATENDRMLFLDLLKVDGIGPKGAVKIMGSIDCNELAGVLDSGDVGRLEKVPGVGKKTAAKMMLQLKGKLTLDTGASTQYAARKNSPYADVISALVDMGYDRTRAAEAIERISGELGSDDSFAKSSQSQREDLLFRRAIVELAN